MPDDSEMVEHVAKALAWDGDGAHWDRMVEEERDNYRRRASIAIEAMRVIRNDISYQASRSLEEIEKMRLDDMTAGDLCALACNGTRDRLSITAIRELTFRLVERGRAENRHQRIGSLVEAAYRELRNA